jgi:ankyrin repeat protein
VLELTSTPRILTATGRLFTGPFGHVQVVKELLEHGADIEAEDNCDSTPLHRACYNGHVAVGNELLSRGSNIEAKTDEGDTPLHWASYVLICPL